MRKHRIGTDCELHGCTVGGRDLMGGVEQASSHRLLQPLSHRPQDPNRPESLESLSQVLNLHMTRSPLKVV
jgi:hypothetical protein